MDASNHDNAWRGGFMSRLSRAALDELKPLVSLRVLADVATALPSPALSRTRSALFRAAGVQLGARSQIQGPMRLTGVGDFCSLLSIGSDTMITGTLHVDLGGRVRIGDWVRIGHDVSLLTISHAIGPAWFRAGTSFFGDIVVENGCWIASRVTVLPGVTLGAGSIVAAGAVVTRSVPPNTLVAGVPARIVRELAENGEDRAVDTSDSVRPGPSDGHP